MYRTKFGVSFSLHHCSELGVNKKDVLKGALNDLGFRRFRLMSYWNIHEQSPGSYNFDELDWQLDLIARYGGQVSLSLGVRQPRWPEWHMPDWARNLPSQEWYPALYAYIEAVVDRYRNHPALESWQLENEALLKDFGTSMDFNRQRLYHERDIVKKLDPNHPLVMTLSDSWGLPWRGPRPDVYGMSLYRFTVNKYGRLNHSMRPALFYRFRRGLIRLYSNRPTFIHELQAEPWFSEKITDVPVKRQLEWMNPLVLREHIDYAQRTGANPIDLWGLEWWYWLNADHNYQKIWQTVKTILSTT